MGLLASLAFKGGAPRWASPSVAKPRLTASRLDSIAATLRNIPNIELRIVDYNGKFPFVEQLRQTQNSDVFIGMHGSGLTHLLFLPDWAAIFEIYNCGDVGCYYDLARLRDVKYVTWPTNKEHLIQSEGGDGKQRAASAHKKFLNYRFDVDEFKRIVTNIVEYVRRHPKFVEARRKRKRLLTTTKTPEL